MLVKDMCPISTVSNPGFKKLVNTLDKRYVLPSRKHLSRVALSPEDHTGINIADGLKQAMAAWDLREENLVCITTDNASNVKPAAQLNGWIRLQCFGHRLHLVIGEKCSFILIV